MNRPEGWASESCFPVSGWMHLIAQVAEMCVSMDEECVYRFQVVGSASLDYILVKFATAECAEVTACKTLPTPSQCIQISLRFKHGQIT